FGPSHDVNDAKQLAISTAGDLCEGAERSDLAAMVAGGRGAAGIMQCGIVVGAGGEGGAVAGPPCRRISPHGLSGALSRRLACGIIVSICHGADPVAIPHP